ncbi:MAG: ribokinase [Firmicutes bacterium]|nr:ribokinase [Candidatus Fermentithermobacillaceae bacterium]
MRLPGASPGVERSSVRVDIVVFGSLNVDFVVRAPVRPRAGETVRGWGFQLFPGGKGANQAVAAARAGGRVVMAGRVGEDAFKDILLRSLKEAGVDARLVEVTPGTETGSAFITVDDAGQNSIVIVPGANARCSAEDVERVRPLLSAAKVLMLQLEIPMEAVEMAARTASASGVKVLLDPAPAMEMPESLWESVDVITPNEHEAAFLTGHEISDFPEAERAAAALLNRGPRWVVVKMGSRGAVSAYRNSSGGVIFRRFPAFSVPVVDATAAGDAFAGGLAVALCEGKDWDEAIRFASATAALSVTKPGAQTSMPSREEIDAFLRQRGASDLSPSGRG